MTSHWRVANLATSLEHLRRFCFVLLPCAVSLLGSEIACADLYKWLDERGNLVISNARPADPEKARNFEVVLRESNAGGATAQLRKERPTRTEQALLDRIDKLERQLAAQQYGQGVPPAGYYGSYDPAPPPPPPVDYYGSHYPGTYYSSVRAYPYVVYPARIFVSRPRIAFARPAVVHGSAVHRRR